MQSLFDLQDDEDTKPCGRVLCIAVGCPASLARAWSVCAERASVQLRLVGESQASSTIRHARPAAILLTPGVFARNADLYKSLGRGLPVVQIPVAPFDAKHLTHELSRILERTRITPPRPSGLRIVNGSSGETGQTRPPESTESSSTEPSSTMGSYRWVNPAKAPHRHDGALGSRVASADSLATSSDGFIFKTKLCVTFEEPQSAEVAETVLRRCRREVRRIFDGLVSGGSCPLREDELAQRLRVRLAGSRPALDLVEVVAPFRMMSRTSLAACAAEVGPDRLDVAESPFSE